MTERKNNVTYQVYSLDKEKGFQMSNSVKVDSSEKHLLKVYYPNEINVNETFSVDITLTNLYDFRVPVIITVCLNSAYFFLIIIIIKPFSFCV